LHQSLNFKGTCVPVGGDEEVEEEEEEEAEEEEAEEAEAEEVVASLRASDAGATAT
jgi:CO dehydrogenase/acetyl-CoA synthase beta subunit